MGDFGEECILLGFFDMLLGNDGRPDGLRVQRVAHPTRLLDEDILRGRRIRRPLNKWAAFGLQNEKGRYCDEGL